MGNDITWRGNIIMKEEQDRCTEFLRRVCEEDAWEYEILSGRIRGNIIDSHTRFLSEMEGKGGVEAFFPGLEIDSDDSDKPGPLFQTEVDLNGIRIFPMGKEHVIKNFIGYHLSFVFNNSFHGYIYTIEDESLRGEDNYYQNDYYRKKYGGEFDPSLPIYEINPGGSMRSLGEPLRVLLILELIRSRYVKNLTLSCDYSISEETRIWLKKKISNDIKSFDDEEAFVREAVASVFSDY